MLKKTIRVKMEYYINKEQGEIRQEYKMVV